MSIQSCALTPEQLVEAMRIAMHMGGAPLETAGNVLATACVAAAARRPEWAAAYAMNASADVRALGEAIVWSSHVLELAEPA